ncbi:thioredoxin family protein [Cetobacterium sp. 8H]|uniref:thioredoxin family protein n=1 Tax=Cetobacterium sp. 8H TaxID=2759681 RepID=UPI00163CF449|nr:thioredoxin family protein [Cetobacterium sp. 8H]MBC2851966.1 thioredoxin family protein [Cetobacterium sp. 8H]
MDIKTLYSAGMNFEAFMGTGIKSERDRIPKNYSRIVMTQEQIDKVRNIGKKINFLVSGEPWCMDFQLNVTVLKKFCELNANFDMAIITKARGEKFLKPILGVEEFKVPFIVPLSQEFEICGEAFIERPKEVKKYIYEDVKMDYLKGEYLKCTVEDLIEMISE